VVIEENVFIGDNVSILGPVRIGYGAVIAANSFVTSDVPPNMIVGGSPARPLKQFELSSMSWKRK
jgi:acetyltransferase-like isoleucine patch superfamily enzyme